MGKEAGCCKYMMKLALLTAILVTACFTTVVADQTVMATGPLQSSVSNPRYFTDGSQKAIYLTGSHTWANFQDMGTVDPPPEFDYTAYVNFMEAHGHNFMRMWVEEQAQWVPWTTVDVYVDPLPYVREEPDFALDNKPKFNLERFNQKYFDRLRSRVSEAGEHGIYVSIMLFNGWSIERKGQVGNPWSGHPFNRSNNINGIDGDMHGANEGTVLHTLSVDPKIVAALIRQEAYVKKVIDTVNDLDNVLYEITNEDGPSSIPWQYHIINVVKSYEATKPRQHPVGMTGLYESGGKSISNASLYDSPADWISPNNSEPHYLNDPPPAYARKVIIIDTDHLWGIGGEYSWVWKSFIRGLNPIFMDPWEHLPGSPDPKNDPNLPVLESVRKAMGDTLRYAKRIDLAAMEPLGDVASTGYCLANQGEEYLIYLPSNEGLWVGWVNRFHLHRVVDWISQLIGWGQTVSVNLSGSSKAFHVEWFNPRTAETTLAGTTRGGTIKAFTAPFPGDAVLYVHAQK